MTKHKSGLSDALIAPFKASFDAFVRAQNTNQQGHVKTDAEYDLITELVAKRLHGKYAENPTHQKYQRDYMCEGNNAHRHYLRKKMYKKGIFIENLPVVSQEKMFKILMNNHIIRGEKKEKHLFVHGGSGKLSEHVKETYANVAGTYAVKFCKMCPVCNGTEIPAKVLFCSNPPDDSSSTAESSSDDDEEESVLDDDER